MQVKFQRQHTSSVCETRGDGEVPLSCLILAKLLNLADPHFSQLQTLWIIARCFFIVAAWKCSQICKRKRKKMAFLTQLTAALRCLAHKAKCYFSCAALVIHLTGANVLNRKERWANAQLSCKLGDGLQQKSWDNATGRLPWGRGEEASPPPGCMDSESVLDSLRAPRGGTITDPLSTPQHRQAD